MLWIAFRLYLWNIGHSILKDLAIIHSVVNCFQIVSLKYWSQHFTIYIQALSCCELLSDCIFEILVTAILPLLFLHCLLWIAFRLYLWNIGHSNKLLSYEPTAVVNCFQIVSLKYWSQRIGLLVWIRLRCELLSDCIFEILVTAIGTLLDLFLLLWIAFRLYLWNIGHSGCIIWVVRTTVVNCFQIVSLKYWSQLQTRVERLRPSCELLSDCIFEILVTACHQEEASHSRLWIAFRLYLWNIGHSGNWRVRR